MSRRQPPLPRLWLVSDVRNDAALERVLERLPRGSGFIYRHYHLAPEARRARFERLARVARRRGHAVILAGSPGEARQWRADGLYCSPAKAGASGLGQVVRGGLRPPPSRWSLMTAHSLREIGAANRAGADAVLLSSAFPTRSHPGAKALGAARFRLLAARAKASVIALGGMTARRARRLGWLRWAAIDGFCAGLRGSIPTDS